MLPVVRIYTSEQNGLDAAREAEQAGFARVYFLAQSDVAGQEQEAVRSAVEAQCIASGPSRLETSPIVLSTF